MFQAWPFGIGILIGAPFPKGDYFFSWRFLLPVVLCLWWMTQKFLLSNIHFTVPIVLVIAQFMLRPPYWKHFAFDSPYITHFCPKWILVIYLSFGIVKVIYKFILIYVILEKNISFTSLYALESSFKKNCQAVCRHL